MNLAHLEKKAKELDEARRVTVQWLGEVHQKRTQETTRDGHYYHSTPLYYALIRLASRLGVSHTQIREVTGLSKVQISKIVNRRTTQ